MPTNVEINSSDGKKTLRIAGRMMINIFFQTKPCNDKH